MEFENHNTGMSSLPRRIWITTGAKSYEANHTTS